MGPSRCPGFRTSPDVLRLALVLCVCFPLLLRNVEDLLHEGVSRSATKGRFGWQRFGPMLTAEIRTRRVGRMWFSC